MWITLLTSNYKLLCFIYNLTLLAIVIQFANPLHLQYYIIKWIEIFFVCEGSIVVYFWPFRMFLENNQLLTIGEQVLLPI